MKSFEFVLTAFISTKFITMEAFNVVLYYMGIFFRPPRCVAHRGTDLGDHNNPFPPQDWWISASSAETHQMFWDDFVSFLVTT